MPILSVLNEPLKLLIAKPLTRFLHLEILLTRGLGIYFNILSLRLLLRFV